MLLTDEPPRLKAVTDRTPTSPFADLATLAAVSRELAAATRPAALRRAACAGLQRLIDADRCRILPPDTEDLGAHVLVAGPGERTLAVALDGADGHSGILVAERVRPFDATHQHLLRVVAHQLSLALQKAELLARLADEHLVRDLFDALVDGRVADAEAHARAAGHDLERPHVIVLLQPVATNRDRLWPPAAALVEARLRTLVPAALFDAGDDQLRVLVPLAPGDADVARLDIELQALAREERLVAGRSEPRRGLAAGDRGLAEAASALAVVRAVSPAGGTRGYGDLGVYRYLAQVPAAHTPDERHAEAIANLAAYDAKRRTELLATLERHLGDRGALAATARALYIHTNTLRQRLDRIEQLTGLVLADEDLLSLELALKLARLRGVAAA